MNYLPSIRTNHIAPACICTLYIGRHSNIKVIYRYNFKLIINYFYTLYVPATFGTVVQNFIRVYTVFLNKNKKDLQREKEMKKILTCNPSIYTTDHPKFIVSNQKEESIITHRVKEKNNWLIMTYIDFKTAEMTRHNLLTL